ncbi:hypothetical protein R0K17_09545 [Planococcus sp. SIMBA_143]
MNRNEELRKDLIEFLVENGVKLNFISTKTGISIDSLSKWKRGLFNFKVDKLVKIRQFLDENER